MHTSVLLKETLEALNPRAGGAYIDATLGGGGHAEAILSASGPDSRLLGLDRDPDAIQRCRSRLAPFGTRAVCVHAPFSTLPHVAAACGFERADGIVLDLGVSSFQLDDPARGFSFMHDGPLDMRMDTSGGMTAAALLDSLDGDWRRLAGILGDFADEPAAGRIAKAIVAGHARQPITTTRQLADVVEHAVGGRRGAPRHPATRTFQALRIAVNAETEQARDGIEAAIDLLADDGVLVVITFHSIEDRIAKQTLSEHIGRMVSLQQGGQTWTGRQPAVSRLHRRPVSPGADEISSNPRARSAKLRAVRRLPRQD